MASAEPRSRALLTFGSLGTAKGRRDAWQPVLAAKKQRSSWASWAWGDSSDSEHRARSGSCASSTTAASTISPSPQSRSPTELEAAFAQLAPVPFRIEKTFVTVGPRAARRRASCPARFVPSACTVMLRNLPNRAKASRVAQHMWDLGFQGNGMYMPIDPRTGVNKGYVFIRLPDEATAAAFCDAVQNTRLPLVPGSRSSKRLTAAFAANQGALRIQLGHPHESDFQWPCQRTG